MDGCDSGGDRRQRRDRARDGAAFARRGDAVALLARGENGLAGGRRGTSSGRRQGSCRCRSTSPTPQAVFAAADRVEAEVGPIDVWVNVAFTSVFAPFEQITPEEYRRVTEVSYLGYVYGTMAALRADEAARPRHDRAGRLGAGLPRHPAADGVLRGQARDPGLPRGAALRAAAREEQRARDDGADAGGQHPAVLVGAVPAAAPRAAGAADLPARGRRPRRPVRRRPPAAPRVLGRRDARWPPWPANAVAPGLLDRYLGTDRVRLAADRTSRATRTRPANLWEPADGDRRARTSARTAMFDSKSTDAGPAAVGLPPPRLACRRGAGALAAVGALLSKRRR